MKRADIFSPFQCFYVNTINQWLEKISGQRQMHVGYNIARLNSIHLTEVNFGKIENWENAFFWQ